MMLDILFKGTQPVYNVGGNSRTSILELAQRISGITGAEYSTGKDSIQGAPDDVKLSLALTLTEFPRTFVSLDEGLKRTIEYQKQLYGK
jgi:nucleoside-diphosphate-sugar epimerase